MKVVQKLQAENAQLRQQLAHAPPRQHTTGDHSDACLTADAPADHILQAPGDKPVAEGSARVDAAAAHQVRHPPAPWDPISSGDAAASAGNVHASPARLHPNLAAMPQQTTQSGCDQAAECGKQWQTRASSNAQSDAHQADVSAVQACCIDAFQSNGVLTASHGGSIAEAGCTLQPAGTAELDSPKCSNLADSIDLLWTGSTSSEAQTTTPGLRTRGVVSQLQQVNDACKERQMHRPAKAPTHTNGLQQAAQVGAYVDRSSRPGERCLSGAVQAFAHVVANFLHLLRAKM